MNYNKKNNTNNAKTKPITKVLPIVITGMAGNGAEYNPDSCVDILTDLQNADVWNKLSIFATLDNKICMNNRDAKGFRNVARIQNYNIADGSMELVFFGKNTEFAGLTDGMVVVPSVRVGYNTVDVTTIMGFKIVPEMEA